MSNPRERLSQYALGILMEVIPHDSDTQVSRALGHLMAYVDEVVREESLWWASKYEASTHYNDAGFQAIRDLRTRVEEVLGDEKG